MRLILAVLLLCLTGTAACAAERIADFASDIEVAPDGILTVTETIRVETQGVRIRHGITREIPTEYRTPSGAPLSVHLHFLGARLDGASVPYRIEEVTSGSRMRIGRADTLLAPGPHVFTITYTVDHELGFFSDHDELYWNVTGNFWRFPIDHAEALVRLPPAARILRTAFSTGPAGARGEAATAHVLVANRWDCETTAPLAANEGLTIVVGFAKGAVIPPPEPPAALVYAEAHPALLIAIAGLVVLICYLCLPMVQDRQGLRRGVIIPLFAPPGNLPPCAIRYVRRRGYDKTCFSAAVVSMAVKKYLTITEIGREFTLTHTGTWAGDAGLAPPEAELGRTLFYGCESIALATRNAERITAGMRALTASLVARYRLPYFHHRWRWALGGLAITGATTALIVYHPAGAPLRVPLPVVMLQCIAWATALWYAMTATGQTQQGVTLLEQIEGFRLFLSLADKDRLEMLNPPDITPQLFERFLPYAIALDCANRWSARFAAAAAAARASGDAFDYSPGWYVGNGFDVNDPVGFASGLDSSLASAAAAFATSPGSSSGFDGGGGDSGGGGGGGGGDGW